MALTDLQLCSRALMKLGATGISSFSTGSAEADIANALYVITRDALLSAYPWSFAGAQAQLVASSADPVEGYAFCYDLPSDFLRAVSAGPGESARGARYRLAGGKLHTNAPTIHLSYIYRPDEADCPPFFDAVLVARLAAEFCIPLTENTQRAESLFKIAEEELKRARNIDAQQDTPPRIDRFSLIDARG